MKNKLICLFIMIMIVAAVWGQDANTITVIPNESAFEPRNPEMLGQGGSFTAISHGYYALFNNPAGFSMPGGSATLVSSSSWMFLRPMDTTLSEENRMLKKMNQLQSAGGNSTQMISVAEELIVEQFTYNNGIGAGASAGIGFVGNGLGLGIAAVSEVIVQDPSGNNDLLNTEVDAVGTIGLIGGLSIPLKFGDNTLHVGADVRPMLRIRKNLDATTAGDLLSVFMGSSSSNESNTEENGGGDSTMSKLMKINVMHGMGLGIDFGVIYETNPFQIGFSIRDFGGTKFNYVESSIEDAIAEYSGGSEAAAGVSVAEKYKKAYVIPMNVAAGFAFHPDLGVLSILLDPKAHIEVDDLFGLVNPDASIWTKINMGAEVNVLRMFKVRAGLNGGFPTVGIGIHLFIIELNVAVFTLQTADLAGYTKQYPVYENGVIKEDADGKNVTMPIAVGGRTGVAIEAAFRF